VRGSPEQPATRALSVRGLSAKALAMSPRNFAAGLPRGVVPTRPRGDFASERDFEACCHLLEQTSEGGLDEIAVRCGFCRTTK